jgi:S1-C subfamily serine protease
VRVLPPPRASDPAFEVPIPHEPQSSSGTAFALDNRGTWMTARHVADGCSRIFILTGPREGYRVRDRYIHPVADVAVLRTDRGAPPLTFSDAEPRTEQTGYHFGYPKGQPGAVLTTLLGRANMRASGRYRTSEPVLVWAERERVPESEDHLGGISGGPAFNASGLVIGVTVAGSMRRGRVFTADMSSVRAALARANVTPVSAETAEKPELRRGNWVEEGAALRRKLTVAKVICLVEPRF